MMRVKGVLLCFITIALFLNSTVYAQVPEKLPDPGVTPDSPFYFVDLWAEKIKLFFAFSAEAKAEESLENALERLAEAHVMAAKDKPEAIKLATSKYEENITKAVEEAEKAREKAKDISPLSEIVALATSTHLSILDGIIDIVPETARTAMEKAKEVSISGHKNALRALATANPTRAMEINLITLESRLNRTKEKAEENQIEEVENALEEFERLHKFGQEISQIAQGAGKDIASVELLVAKATSIHLEVLAKIYQKVPEQAKAAIERAVETLKEKGVSDRVPQVPPVPATIPEEVKERTLKPKVPPDTPKTPSR